jgi:hypothetical protein
MPDWRGMIERGEAEALARLAEEVVGFPVPEDRFLAECAEHVERHSHTGSPLGEDWNETWEVWLRNRAEAYRPSSIRQRPVGWVVGVLHVGMASVVETEEHLENLRREHRRPADAKPARSKITDTPVVISPIDKTASIVTGVTRGRRKYE